MSADLAISVVLGLLAAAMTLVAYTSANRANRIQARAAVVSVEADAYGRAKLIYEGALGTLQEEVASCRVEIATLRQEVEVWRANDRALQEQVEAQRLEILRLRNRTF